MAPPAAEETDARLLGRWQAGEAGAGDALYARWAPRIRRYLCVLLGRSRVSWADDCLQEVFLRVGSRAARYDESLPFSAWLLAIAHHEAMRLHRRERLRAFLPFPAHRPAVPPRDPALEEALASLPQDIRSAILLVHLEGLSRKEAAEAMGMTERRVQDLCHQGFERLRIILKKS